MRLNLAFGARTGMDRILFCDTNIIRYILDTPNACARFTGFLRDEGLLHAISLIQVTELLRLPRYHGPLAQLVFEADSFFLDWWKGIIYEEAQAYPQTNRVEVLSRPSIRSHYPGSHGPDDLRRALAGKDLELLWTEFEDQKVRYKPVMDWLPSTLPRSRTKRSIDVDFSLHNYGVVLTVLRDVAPEFVEVVKVDPEAFMPTLFRGAYLHAAYNYYRFILKGMRSQPSDVMDVHQVFYVPYCAMVITEKSMAGLFSQLKKDRSLIDTVQIQSMRYARSAFGPKAGFPRRFP